MRHAAPLQALILSLSLTGGLARGDDTPKWFKLAPPSSEWGYFFPYDAKVPGKEFTYWEAIEAKWNDFHFRHSGNFHHSVFVDELIQESEMTWLGRERILKYVERAVAEGRLKKNDEIPKFTIEIPDPDRPGTMILRSEWMARVRANAPDRTISYLSRNLGLLSEPAAEALEEFEVGYGIIATRADRELAYRFNAEKKRLGERFVRDRFVEMEIDSLVQAERRANPDLSAEEVILRQRVLEQTVKRWLSRANKLGLLEGVRVQVSWNVPRKEVGEYLARRDSDELREARPLNDIIVWLRDQWEDVPKVRELYGSFTSYVVFELKNLPIAWAGTAPAEKSVEEQIRHLIKSGEIDGLGTRIAWSERPDPNGEFENLERAFQAKLAEWRRRHRGDLTGFRDEFAASYGLIARLVDSKITWERIRVLREGIQTHLPRIPPHMVTLSQCEEWLQGAVGATMEGDRGIVRKRLETHWSTLSRALSLSMETWTPILKVWATTYDLRALDMAIHHRPDLMKARLEIDRNRKSLNGNIGRLELALWAIRTANMSEWFLTLQEFERTLQVHLQSSAVTLGSRSEMDRLMDRLRKGHDASGRSLLSVLRFWFRESKEEIARREILEVVAESFSSRKREDHPSSIIFDRGAGKWFVEILVGRTETEGVLEAAFRGLETLKPLSVLASADWGALAKAAVDAEPDRGAFRDRVAEVLKDVPGLGIVEIGTKGEIRARAEGGGEEVRKDATKERGERPGRAGYKKGHTPKKGSNRG